MPKKKKKGFFSRILSKVWTSKVENDLPSNEDKENNPAKISKISNEKDSSVFDQFDQKTPADKSISDNFFKTYDKNWIRESNEVGKSKQEFRSNSQKEFPLRVDSEQRPGSKRHKLEKGNFLKLASKKKFKTSSKKKHRFIKYDRKASVCNDLLKPSKVIIDTFSALKLNLNCLNDIKFFENFIKMRNKHFFIFIYLKTFLSPMPVFKIAITFPTTNSDFGIQLCYQELFQKTNSFAHM